MDWAETIVVPLHFRGLPAGGRTPNPPVSMWPPYGEPIAVAADRAAVRLDEPGLMIACVRDDAALGRVLDEHRDEGRTLLALCTPQVGSLRGAQEAHPTVRFERGSDFSPEVLASAAERATRRAVYAAHLARLTRELGRGKARRVRAAAMPTLATIAHAHVCAARGLFWPQSKVAERVEESRATVLRVGSRLPGALVRQFAPAATPTDVQVLAIGQGHECTALLGDALRAGGRDPVFSFARLESGRERTSGAEPAVILLPRGLGRERRRGLAFRLRSEHPFAVLVASGDPVAEDVIDPGCDLVLDHRATQDVARTLVEHLAARARERSLSSRLADLERDVEGLAPEGLGRSGVSLRSVLHAAHELARGVAGSRVAAAQLLAVGRGPQQRLSRASEVTDDPPRDKIHR